MFFNAAFNLPVNTKLGSVLFFSPAPRTNIYSELLVFFFGNVIINPSRITTNINPKETIIFNTLKRLFFFFNLSLIK